MFALSVNQPSFTKRPANAERPLKAQTHSSDCVTGALTIVQEQITTTTVNALWKHQP